MKIIKLLTILFVALIIKSCTPDEGSLRPTRGENSFSAKINGKQFMAEDVEEFANTTYGISAYENNKTWQLTFRNSSKLDIYFYLYQVNEEKNYLVGDADGDLVYYLESDDETSVSISDGTGYNTGVAFSSDSSGADQFITITDVQGDSIIIGQFKKLTLSDPKNPNNKTILTDGFFNINRNTLNNRDNL